ncbi:MAG: hypothetical protein ACJAV5_001369 [Vicingaceae bacterium]|jgi:hypothetical protein
MNHIYITLFFLICINTQAIGQNRKVIGTINDLSLIEDDDKIGIIDNHNNYVVIPDNYIKIEYDKEFDLYRCFKEIGFEICFENGEKVVSDYLFTDILESDGNTYKVKGKEGIGYIKNTSIMIPPIYDNIVVEPESYFDCCLNYIVEKDDKKGLFIDGHLVLKPDYEEFIRDKNYSHFIVVKDHKKGLVYPLLSEENEIIEFLPPIYSSIELKEGLDDGPLYIVSTENKFGLFLVTVDMFPLDEIKSSAYFVVPPKFNNIQWDKKTAINDFGETIYLVPVKKQGFVLFLINKSTDCLETSKIIFSDDSTYPLAIKGKNDKFQFISSFEELTLDDNLYDEITPLSEGLVAVKKDNKWGGIMEGSILIPIKHNTLEELKIAYENSGY